MLRLLTLEKLKMINNNQLIDEGTIKIRKNLKIDYFDQSGSQLNHKKSIKEIVNLLDGKFAFVLYDETNSFFMIARDPIGLCPLYWG